PNSISRKWWILGRRLFLRSGDLLYRSQLFWLAANWSGPSWRCPSLTGSRRLGWEQMKLQLRFRETLIKYVTRTLLQPISLQNEVVSALRVRLTELTACASLVPFFLVLAGAVPAGAVTVNVSPGANLQAAINAYPQGTTFSLGAGIY